MEKPHKEKPPIAPKPTKKQQVNWKSDSARQNVVVGNSSSNDSSAEPASSLVSSNSGNSVLADVKASSLDSFAANNAQVNASHPSEVVVPTQSNSETVLNTLTSPDTNDNNTSPAQQSFKPSPRKKKSSPMRELNDSNSKPEAKMRDKSGSVETERDSKPARGTVFDLLSKFDASESKTGIPRPVPKPRGQSILLHVDTEPAASVVSLRTDSEKMASPKKKASPIPKPRNSLLLSQPPEVMYGIHCGSKTEEPEVATDINSAPQNNNNAHKLTDVNHQGCVGEDDNHYGQVWVDKPSSRRSSLSEPDIPNSKSSLPLPSTTHLERAASAPVKCSPKIKPRRPSAPPPAIPPSTGPAKANTKKIGPGRPPPPTPKSQVNTKPKISPRSSQAGACIYTDPDVTENIYHVPDTGDEVFPTEGTEPAKDGDTVHDTAIARNSNPHSTSSDDEYMVPTEKPHDLPEEDAPLPPGQSERQHLKADTMLSAASSNHYEDLISISSDDAQSSVSDDLRSKDFYSDFVDDKLANAEYLKESSSESDGDSEEGEDSRLSKQKKKAYQVAHEIMTTEEEFCDKLVLLNIDFRQHLSSAAEEHGEPVIPAECTNRILNQLPQLANINEDLLKDFKERVDNWDENPRISDVFVRKGPFLQMYTTYIRDFQNMTNELDNAIKEYPLFAESLKAFERSERCRNLQLRHYMLKPIQRIPQYRLMLNEYKKCLPADSPDWEDTQQALEIVSKVADHANEAMKLNDSLRSLLELQNVLIGEFTVIEPWRVLVKRGDVSKQSRKELQPRTLFLFNDYLLITSLQVGGHCKIKHVLPVANMEVNKPTKEDFQKEFTIITNKRSMAAVASSPKESDEWVTTLQQTIAERQRKIATYNHGLMLDKGSKAIGEVAPVWVPDDRVTMCMKCSTPFTVFNRRHHCRACGKVACGHCSVFRAPLKYEDYRPMRSCEDCYDKLLEEAKEAVKSPTKKNSLPSNIIRLFAIKGGRARKEHLPRVPIALKVPASDTGELSGYLNVYNKRKKQWEKFWFVLKDKVLYKYNACEDARAIESKVLLGFTVAHVDTSTEGFGKIITFELRHPSPQVEPMLFKADSIAEKWMANMEASTKA